MSFTSSFKNEIKILASRMSFREGAALLGTSLSGALVSIVISLNREEMAKTGQWLPTENLIFLISLFIILFGFLLFLPIAIFYHKTGNNGTDERDKTLHHKTATNGFYVLQVFIGLALLWYVQHGDGLLLFNSIIVGILLSFTLFFFTLYLRYRAMSPNLFSDGNE